MGDTIVASDQDRAGKAKAAKERYKKAHPDRLQAAEKKRYARDPEKEKARSRAYRLANPERVKEYDKKRHQALRQADPEGLNAKLRAWRRANADKARASVRRSVYKAQFGISVQTYERVLAEQGYKCALCGAQPDKKRLHVDHCHVGGGVRGLLCFKCNTMLGLAKDNATLLRKAADYLERAA